MQALQDRGHAGIKQVGLKSAFTQSQELGTLFIHHNYCLDGWLVVRPLPVGLSVGWSIGRSVGLSVSRSKAFIVFH